MQTTTTTIPKERIPAGKLAGGIALLIIGVVSFVEAIDLWSTRDLWRLWPLVMIFLGLASEADALQARKSDGSFILIAIGVWMLAATQRFLGLGYGSAMPLAIVIVGLGLMVHAVIDVPTEKEKENDHA